MKSSQNANIPIGILVSKALIESAYLFCTGTNIDHILPSNDIFTHDMVRGLYHGLTGAGPALVYAGDQWLTPFISYFRDRNTNRM